jgi:hypothetical protein
MSFCEEHSEVMRCLGALEQGQRDVKDLLTGIDAKIIVVQKLQSNGNTQIAVEKTKSGLLYWVIAIAAGGLILGLINFALRQLKG